MTTIHYQFTEMEAVRTMFKVRRWNHPWEIIKGTVSAVLGAATIVAVYIYRDRGSRPGIAAVGFGLLAFLIPIFYLAMRFRIRQAIARQVRTKPQIIAPEELSFDDESLTLSSGSTRQGYTWTIFTGRRQDDLFFYLYCGAGGIFMIIPKRAFDGDSLVEFVRCGRFS